MLPHIHLMFKTNFSRQSFLKIYNEIFHRCTASNSNLQINGEKEYFYILSRTRSWIDQQQISDDTLIDTLFLYHRMVLRICHCAQYIFRYYTMTVPEHNLVYVVCNYIIEKLLGPSLQQNIFITQIMVKIIKCERRICLIESRGFSKTDKKEINDIHVSRTHSPNENKSTVKCKKLNGMPVISECFFQSTTSCYLATLTDNFSPCIFLHFLLSTTDQLSIYHSLHKKILEQFEGTMRMIVFEEMLNSSLGETETDNTEAGAKAIPIQFVNKTGTQPATSKPVYLHDTFPNLSDYSSLLPLCEHLPEDLFYFFKLIREGIVLTETVRALDQEREIIEVIIGEGACPGSNTSKLNNPSLLLNDSIESFHKKMDFSQFPTERVVSNESAVFDLIHTLKTTRETYNSMPIALLFFDILSTIPYTSSHYTALFLLFLNYSDQLVEDYLGTLEVAEWLMEETVQAIYEIKIGARDWKKYHCNQEEWHSKQNSSKDNNENSSRDNHMGDGSRNEQVISSRDNHMENGSRDKHMGDGSRNEQVISSRDNHMGDGSRNEQVISSSDNRMENGSRDNHMENGSRNERVLSSRDSNENGSRDNHMENSSRDNHMENGSRNERVFSSIDSNENGSRGYDIINLKAVGSEDANIKILKVIGSAQNTSVNALEPIHTSTDNHISHLCDKMYQTLLSICNRLLPPQTISLLFMKQLMHKRIERKQLVGERVWCTDWFNKNDPDDKIHAMHKNNLMQNHEASEDTREKDNIFYSPDPSHENKLENKKCLPCYDSQFTVCTLPLYHYFPFYYFPRIFYHESLKEKPYVGMINNDIGALLDVMNHLSELEQRGPYFTGSKQKGPHFTGLDQRIPFISDQSKKKNFFICDNGTVRPYNHTSNCLEDDKGINHLINVTDTGDRTTYTSFNKKTVNSSTYSENNIDHSINDRNDTTCNRELNLCPAHESSANLSLIDSRFNFSFLLQFSDITFSFQLYNKSTVIKTNCMMAGVIFNMVKVLFWELEEHYVLEEKSMKSNDRDHGFEPTPFKRDHSELMPFKRDPPPETASYKNDNNETACENADSHDTNTFDSIGHLLSGELSPICGINYFALFREHLNFFAALALSEPFLKNDINAQCMKYMVEKGLLLVEIDENTPKQPDCLFTRFISWDKVIPFLYHNNRDVRHEVLPVFTDEPHAFKSLRISFRTGHFTLDHICEAVETTSRVNRTFRVEKQRAALMRKLKKKKSMRMEDIEEKEVLEYLGTNGYVRVEKGWVYYCP